MTTIDKKHKEKVMALRKLIKMQSKAQDYMFKRLCAQLSIDPESADGETLWDHIYNETDWTVSYE